MLTSAGDGGIRGAVSSSEVAALVRHLIYQYLQCVEQSAMASQADTVIVYSESHDLPSTMHQLELSRHWSLTVCQSFGGDCKVACFHAASRMRHFARVTTQFQWLHILWNDVMPQ